MFVTCEVSLSIIQACSDGDDTFALESSLEHFAMIFCATKWVATTMKVPTGDPEKPRTQGSHIPVHEYTGWRCGVRQFSPQWFTVTMGSGISAILLDQFPYHSTWLYWISVVALCIHITLLCLFTAISIVRFVLWPELWEATLAHPLESLFLAAFAVVSALNLHSGPSSLSPGTSRYFRSPT
jgi:hypothetical protein